MERSRRCVLWLVSVVFAALLILKGHGDLEKRDSVAFLRYSTPSIMVRIKGNVSSQGIYRFSDDIDVATVINMTEVRCGENMLNRTMFARLLESGNIVDVVQRDGQYIEIRVSSMKSREKILLGMPLDPDSMSVDDWDCLPGIGPGMAKKIIEDRQNNGDFGSITAVGRVPGMGERRIAKILKYF